MSSVGKLHHQAMSLAEQASVAIVKGEHEKAAELFKQAFELEAKAADLLKDEDVEPTRSVLYRSAASLAYQCKEFQAAQKLVEKGLSGCPLPQIEQELKDLRKLVELEYRPLPYHIQVIPDTSRERPSWFARVLELPGCTAHADTFEELGDRIREAMRSWIEAALEDDRPVPEPRTDETYSYPETPRPLHPTSRHYKNALQLLDQATNMKAGPERETLLSEAEDELEFALSEEDASHAPESVQAHIEFERGRLAYLRGDDERAVESFRQAHQVLVAAGLAAEAARANEFSLYIEARRRMIESDGILEERTHRSLEVLDLLGFQTSSPLVHLIAELLREWPDMTYKELLAAVGEQGAAASRETGLTEERLTELLERHKRDIIQVIERRERREPSRMPGSMPRFKQTEGIELLTSLTSPRFKRGQRYDH